MSFITDDLVMVYKGPNPDLNYAIREVAKKFGYKFSGCGYNTEYEKHVIGFNKQKQK